MSLLATKSKPSDEMKRADRRSSITILVLGDESVGKSSLISTFVSRYFSEVVPAIMTRVRLPPDPHTACVTTIVDSQAGDAALLERVSSSLQRSESLAALLDSSSSSLRHTNTNDDDNTNDGSENPGNTDANDIATSKKDGIAKDMASVGTTPLLTSASSTGAMDAVDSIVLVYDLDRVETFFRLENHWLPLIERCYGGMVPVIVAENKMDLFRPSSSGSRSSAVAAAAAAGGGAIAGQTDEQALARKRQQIVSLMQRFPFVRQCIKCSARNLLRVDDVFLKAQQAVLYPFVPPLYDLDTGQLTMECKRAFGRIFRMFDKDHDGLLSDAEIDRFQRDTYHVAVFDRDLAAWKKVVTRNNPSESNESVLQDGKFTIQGFLTIFDVFISQNRLDVVWQALRQYNYDDDLNLHVPESVRNPEDGGSHIPCSTSWKLSSSAKEFLTKLFRQFDSDNDGTLSPDDVVSMFSILAPPGLPPWHPMRAPELFEGCFSVPKVSPRSGSSSGADSPEFEGDTSLILPQVPPMSQSLLTTSGVSILSESDSLPSVDVGGMHPLSRSLSYLEWMGHWHAVSVISPPVSRAELYRLGHVEDVARKGRHASESYRRRGNRGKKKSGTVEERGPIRHDDVYYDASLQSREIRVLVLGSHSCGKTALLNALCGSFGGSLDSIKAVDTSSTLRPESSTTFVKLERTSSPQSGSSASKTEEEKPLVVHLVFTDVPVAAAAKQEQHYRQLSELFGTAASSKEHVCDLAMLTFDCTNPSSLAVAKELEATLLTKETPRVFVGTKSDLIVAPEPEDGDVRPSTVSDEAEIHCRESDLELPFITSALQSGLGSGGVERTKALSHFARCVLTEEPGIDHLKSRPHEEQKRREAARRRKMMWLGGIVSVGVVVAVGVGLLLSSGVPKKDSGRKGTFGWLRSFFGGSSSSSMRTPPQSS